MSGEADDDSSLHEGDLPSVLLPNWKEDAGDAVSFPLLFAALVLVVVVMQAWQSGMISKLLRSKGDLMPMVAPRTSPEFIKFQQSYLVAYLFAVTAGKTTAPPLAPSLPSLHRICTFSMEGSLLSCPLGFSLYLHLHLHLHRFSLPPLSVSLSTSLFLLSSGSVISLPLSIHLSIYLCLSSHLISSSFPPVLSSPFVRTDTSSLYN